MLECQTVKQGWSLDHNAQLSAVLSKIDYRSRSLELSKLLACAKQL